MRARYVALTGAFTTAGTSPDGDTIRFRPDDRRSLLALSGEAEVSKKGTVQVRLEGVDAPELHYEGARQRRSASARTRLLRRLGFSRLELFADYVLRAHGDVRGVVITQSADVHGRVIGFVYGSRDVAVPRDGMVPLGRRTVLASANAHMLMTGAAYPLAYSSLAVNVRGWLRGLGVAARDARLGVWSDDASRAFPLRGVASVGARGALVFPKLFRRCVSSCGEGVRGAAEFVAWLQASRERDDLVQVGARRVRMSALLAAKRDSVRLSVDPLGLVFVPRG